MVIRGNTTEHSIASNDADAFGTGANLEWVYNATTERFEPNMALRTLLDNTTNGPWRVVSVSSITRRGGGGSAPPNAGINNALLPHIRFDELSIFTLTPGYCAITNHSGHGLEATRAGTQVRHTNLVETSRFPADSCTWRTGPDGDRGYRIDQAVFYDGATAGGTPIADPALGYIGKSGRFVEIAS